MNTPSRTPVSNPEYSTPNGESQLSSGSIDAAGASPAAILTKATTANRSRIATWPRVRTRCRWAEISVPITQIAVITTMITTARTTLARSDLRRSLKSKRSKRNSAETSASEPMTRIPVVQIAQPPRKPAYGPIARVTQEKVVPQSVSTRFM